MRRDDLKLRRILEQKVAGHGQITPPVSVRKEPGIAEGDLVGIEVLDQKAVLTPKRLVDKS